LPVIIIVAVDGAYGMEKTAQQRMFGRQADWFGHEHAPVRYDQVAIAMGCHGEYVNKGSEIKSAIERAQSSGKPAVVHAVVDPVANVDPPGNWLWTAARTGKLEMWTDWFQVQSTRFKGYKLLISITLHSTIWIDRSHPLGETVIETCREKNPMNIE